MTVPDAAYVAFALWLMWNAGCAALNVWILLPREVVTSFHLIFTFPLLSVYTLCRSENVKIALSHIY